MRAIEPQALKRWLVLAAAALAIGGGWLLVARHLTLADVQRLAARLAGAAAAQPIAAFAGLALAQAAGMALSLPTKALLALLAGALLGPLGGGAATLLGAFAGTTLLFFGCRRLFGAATLARLGRLAARLEERLRRRPVLAVIGLRLLITLPYGPITIACALVGIRFRQFAIGSLLGDLPVAALYAFAGSRLMLLASTDEAISPVTIAALVAAGVAALVAALSWPTDRTA